MNNRILYYYSMIRSGIVKTKELEEQGIPRYRIKELVDEGYLIKESHGVYSLASDLPDEYAVIQRRSHKLIFSFGTALFFHGLSDRVPSNIDITVPQGNNVSRIKKDYDNLRFHYVKPELLRLGAETVTTPQGNEVVAYNRERCICDIIKAYSHTDRQIFTQAIKEYFESKYPARELIKMSRAIGVEDEIRKYMDVLQ